MKKITKAKFPSWIEYIRIDEVDVGDVPPTYVLARAIVKAVLR